MSENSIAQTTRVDNALTYVKQGWKVFPLHSIVNGKCTCGKSCSSPGKHPRTANGLDDATTSEAVVKAWWNKWPDANIAIATGEGLQVVDGDTAKGANLADLGTLPETLTVKTGSGGVHYYFSCDLPLRNTTDKLGKKIDTRGDGGYVVAPGSNHISGGTYEWVNDAPIARMPNHIIEALYIPKSKPATQAKSSSEDVWSESRNSYLTSIAGGLRNKGLSTDEIRDTIFALNQSRYGDGKHENGPLDEEEIERTILKSADRWEQGLPPQPKERNGQEGKTPVEPRKHTFKLASDFKTEKVTWLWNGRVANGKLTLIQGDPGLGKSLSTIALIASVTAGKPLPDTHNPTRGGVVLIAPEDGIGDTINPRLVAAGADLTKVVTLGMIEELDSEGKPYERPITFPEDGDILAEAIDYIDAKLVVIDPVMAVLGSKIDAYKDPDVRKALAPIIRVAEEKGCAVVGVMHLNKGSAKALYKGGGSIAFVGVARSVFFTVKDPDEPDDGAVLVNIKNNLAPKADSIRILRSTHENGAGYVKWNGVSQHSEDDLTREALVNATNPPSENAQKVIDLIHSRDKAWSIQEVANELGMNYDQAEKLLNRRVASGAIYKPVRGLYTYHANPLYSINPHNGSSGKGSVSELSDASVSSEVSEVSETSKAVSLNGKTDTSLPSIVQQNIFNTSSPSPNGHVKPTTDHSDVSDTSDRLGVASETEILYSSENDLLVNGNGHGKVDMSDLVPLNIEMEDLPQEEELIDERLKMSLAIVYDDPFVNDPDYPPTQGLINLRAAFDLVSQKYQQREGEDDLDYMVRIGDALDEEIKKIERQLQK